MQINLPYSLTSLSISCIAFSHSFQTTSNISTIITPASQNIMPCSQIKQSKGKQAKQQVLVQNKHCPVDVILVNCGSFSIHVVTFELTHVWQFESQGQTKRTCIHWHWEDTCKRTQRKTGDNRKLDVKLRLWASKRIRGLSAGGPKPYTISFKQILCEKFACTAEMQT